MSRRRFKNATIAFLLLVFATVSVAPTVSFASAVGRRNTAIGLTAAALISAIRGSTGAAIALGAGAAYGWKRYHDARMQRAYRRGYYYGYRNGYYHARYARGRYIARRYRENRYRAIRKREAYRRYRHERYVKHR